MRRCLAYFLSAAALCAAMRSAARKPPGSCIARVLGILALVAGAASCRGFDTIPQQEADWQRVQPELVGMSAAGLRQCAGPPWREETTPSGTPSVVYRYADLDNYCEVRLELDRGRVRSFSADHSAPDLFWLVSGANYCGRIFQGCFH